MSFNWKRGVLVGIVSFLYLFAANNFWPDLNLFLNFLILAILIGVTVEISKSVFEKEE